MHPRPSTLHTSQVSWQRFFSSASQLPAHLHYLIQARFASTAPENPYPYPPHSKPTPHQIFHLSSGASQADIKARYYELVRLHHPDSHHCRLLAPEERHARFQSISSAYDVLRRGATRTYPGQSNYDPYVAELDRRKRAYYASHRYNDPYMNAEKPGNEFRDEVPPAPQQLIRERIILCVGVLTIMVGVYPSILFGPFYLDQRHKNAMGNLTQARKEAAEIGEERRARVRERVKDYKQRAEAFENGVVPPIPREVEEILSISTGMRNVEMSDVPIANDKAANDPPKPQDTA